MAPLSPDAAAVKPIGPDTPGKSGEPANATKPLGVIDTEPIPSADASQVDNQESDTNPTESSDDQTRTQEPNLDGEQGSPDDHQGDVSDSQETESDVMPEWFENLFKPEQSWARVTGLQTANVRKKFNELYPVDPKTGELIISDEFTPEQVKEVKDLKEALDMSSYIADSNNKTEFDSKTSQFKKENGEDDYYSRHYKCIYDAAEKWVRDDTLGYEDRQLIEAIGPRLVERVFEVKEGDETHEEIGYVLDTRELKNPVELLSHQARNLFEEGIKRIGERKLDGKNYELAMTTLMEYVSLSNERSALPRGLRYQMIEDLALRIGDADPDIQEVFNDLSVSYKLKDKEGTEHEFIANFDDMVAQARIRRKETQMLSSNPDTNPAVSWFTDKLANSGFSEDEINSFKASIEGQDISSWDLLGEIEGMAFQYKKNSDSVLGSFLKSVNVDITKAGVQIKIPGFAELAKNENFVNLVQTMSSEVFGVAGGINPNVMQWAKQHLNLGKIEKASKRLGRKMNWENWGVGMMLAYSLFGPMMVEGDEEAPSG